MYDHFHVYRLDFCTVSDSMPAFEIELVYEK